MKKVHCHEYFLYTLSNDNESYFLCKAHMKTFIFKTNQKYLENLSKLNFCILILSAIFLGLSQLSQSSGSLSQLSVDVHRAGGASSGRTGTNESLCSELLGVLRRCFSLQPRVRLTVYQVRYS